MMATTTIRFKYYHAWLLADAICNNSGLGFNGYEKDGNPKWDLISNINVISFEVSKRQKFTSILLNLLNINDNTCPFFIQHSLFVCFFFLVGHKSS